MHANAWSGGRQEGGDIMGPNISGTESASAKVTTPPLKNGNDLRESGYLIAVGSRTARFRRKHMHRMRNAILLLLFLLLVIAFLVVLILFIKIKHHKPVRLCSSKQCLRSAANLAMSMDTSVSPCDNFYQYVCGNWASEHPRPDSYTSYDWFRDKQSKVYALVRDMLAKNATDQPKPVQQAKDLYASCMDTDKIEKLGLKPVFRLLESINLPPYPTHINATEDVDLSSFSFDWLETIIKIKTQLGMDVLIGFDIFTDPKNSSVYRLVMGSPETTNPFPSIYKEKRRYNYRRPTVALMNELPRNEWLEDEVFITIDKEEYTNRKKQKKSEGDDEAEQIYKLFYAELIKIFALESGKLTNSKLNEVELDQNIIISANDFYMLSNDVYEIKFLPNFSDCIKIILSKLRCKGKDIILIGKSIILNPERNEGYYHRFPSVARNSKEGEGFRLETDNTTDSDDGVGFNIPEYSVDEIQSHTDQYVESNNGTTQPIWKRYLEGIFNVSDVVLDFEQDKVLVSSLDMKYMEMMALLVSKTHPAVLELYIWVKVVEVLAVHTTKELRLLYYRSYDTRHKHHSDLFFPPRSLQCANAANDMFGMAVAYTIVEPNFYNVTRPKNYAVHTTKELRLLYYRSYDTRHKHHSDLFFLPRSLQCANAANDMFGMAVGAVAYTIVEPHFYNVTRPKILTMIDEIKNALAELVGKVKWMDDDTKLATYRKIINMNAFIGFPKWFYEPGKLEKYYDGIEVSPDTYLENMVNIIQLKVRKGLNSLRNPNHFSWATEPTEVNAYHTFQENTITVPMVMLQYPFFDLGLDSLNYGSLGTVLGHEITHGFDNFGRQFDRNGNLLPWWSNDTIKHYVNMTQCFVEQYSSFYVAELDKHVDGNKTLGENIADNGGLREALAALKYHLWRHGPEEKLPGFEHMTSEQLFFLSYANLWCGVTTKDSLEADLDDEHSPQIFRARGTLQNSEEFARTFNCRPGSPMNPHPKRCIIF